MAEGDPKSGPEVHGTRAAYKKHGCRCPACKAWRSREAAKERARTRSRSKARTTQEKSRFPQRTRAERVRSTLKPVDWAPED